MPCYHPKDIPITHEENGFVQRSTEAGDLQLSFEHVPKGDYTAMFKDLPGGMCQAPHYGYVLKGKVRARYADGTEEIVEAGQAYYVPPGHVPIVLEDTDIIEFTDPVAYKATVEHGFTGHEATKAP